MQLSVLAVPELEHLYCTNRRAAQKKSEVLGENAETPVTVQSLYICVSIG